MKILVIQSTRSGVYYHRQFVPHYTWLDSGDEFYDDGVVIVEDHHLDKLGRIIDNNAFDIVQYSVGIVIPEYIKDFLVFLKHRDNAKIVLDIDDRYVKKAKHVFNSIKDSDAITTTCDYLGRYYKDCGARIPIYTIENGIDSKEKQWQPTPQPEELMFGYVGSTRHEDDLKEMRYDFKSRNLYVVCKEYEEVLDVNKVGHLGHWRDYAKHYKPISVSLAPIVNNPFNKSKSALKLIESGFMKRAVIATKIPPYNRDESLFPAIDLIPKRKSWKERIESYTVEEATQRGEELFKLVQPYEVRNLNKKRRHFYEEIIKL